MHDITIAYIFNSVLVTNAVFSLKFRAYTEKAIVESITREHRGIGDRRPLMHSCSPAVCSGSDVMRLFLLLLPYKYSWQLVFTKTWQLLRCFSVLKCLIHLHIVTVHGFDNHRMFYVFDEELLLFIADDL